MALLVFSFGIFYGFTETISAQTDMDTTAKLNPINSLAVKYKLMVEYCEEILRWFC
jgi:hypothetical protein